MCGRHNEAGCQQQAKCVFAFSFLGLKTNFFEAALLESDG